MNGRVKLKIPKLKDTGGSMVCWGQDAPYDVPFKEPLYEVTAWGRLNLRSPTLQTGLVCQRNEEEVRLTVVERMECPKI